MRARSFGVLMALAVGLAGCGGDGDEAATPKGPTDQAKARAIVLKASDFPPGWTSEPAAGAPDESSNSFRTCMGLLPQASPTAESATFHTVEPGSMTVDASVTVGLSVRLIDQDFSAFASDKALPCVLERFDAQAKRQTEATFGPGEAARLDFAQLGDATSAIRVKSIAVAGDQQIPFHLDIVVVKKGRVGLTFSFANAPEPFPAELATELARKVVDRA